ncbi:MAG: 3'-5' exonuclease [Bdellovibrionales bacterium]|nr:3'-5' exonuclease [Bdellovibrionales bacterium]
MNFIGFDIETTGTLSHQDLIVEIAAVRFQGDQVQETYQSFIEIESAMPAQATAINGITDDMLKGQPSIQEVLTDFAAFCGSHLMVAHNAIFDFQFISRDIKKNQTPSPRGLVLDTYTLSKKVFPQMANYKLATLCDYLKIKGETFHRAKADAVACGHLFLKILKQIPVKNQGDIIEFSERKPLKFPQEFQEGQLSFF